MLRRVVLVAGAGAAAWALRSRSVQRVRTRARAGGPQTVPELVDRRPQALEDGSRTAPVLLPEATAAEVARAVLADPPRSSP